MGNNRTESAGNQGRNNCVSGQCNVGPLWIQRSDRPSQQAAYYCSSNTGLQLGQLRRRTTPETSSQSRPTADQHLSYSDTQSSTANHRGHQQRTIPHPTSIENNKNSDVDNSKHSIDGINQRSINQWQPTCLNINHSLAVTQGYQELYPITAHYRNKLGHKLMILATTSDSSSAVVIVRICSL